MESEKNDLQAVEQQLNEDVDSAETPHLGGNKRSTEEVTPIGSQK
jgi:hypothetical protein